VKKNDKPFAVNVDGRDIAPGEPFPGESEPAPVALDPEPATAEPEPETPKPKRKSAADSEGAES
jgi:hypothetical protein